MEEQADRRVDRRGRQADPHGFTLGKKIMAVIIRRQSEDELRESGQMGQPHGVGNDEVDPKGSGAKLPTSIPALLTADRSARSRSQETTLMLRWESALPVRAAELKAHEVGPPTSLALAIASPSMAFPQRMSRVIPKAWVHL